MSRERVALPMVEEPGREAPPVVCRRLRTKTAFAATPHGVKDWRWGESTTAVYWCLQTMETFGADNAVCHPSKCTTGRSCFVEAGEGVA